MLHDGRLEGAPHPELERRRRVRPAEGDPNHGADRPHDVREERAKVLVDVLAGEAEAPRVHPERRHTRLPRLEQYSPEGVLVHRRAVVGRGPRLPVGRQRKVGRLAVRLEEELVRLKELREDEAGGPRRERVLQPRQADKLEALECERLARDAPLPAQDEERLANHLRAPATWSDRKMAVGGGRAAALEPRRRSLPLGLHPCSGGVHP